MFNKIKLRIRALFYKSTLESELNDELDFHLDREIEENIARGMKPEDARYAALRSFGGVERVKEESRDTRGVRFLDQLWQDLRYAVRMFRKDSSFTIIAIVTLTITISANTAIFSIINAVLFSHLPYKEPDQLVMVWERNLSAERPIDAVTPANLVDWKGRNQVFSDLAASRDELFNLTDSGEPELISGYRFSSNFLRLLGVDAIKGRTFVPEDEVAGNTNVVILSYSLWSRRFNRDPMIIGKQLKLNGTFFTVIGITPENFHHPNKDAQLYAPLAITSTDWSNRESHFLRVVGRLKKGITVEHAQNEMKKIAGDLGRAYPVTNKGWSTYIHPLRDLYIGDVRLSLLILFGAVGFLLFIACANIGNLILARSVTRQREMAIRTSLGVTRYRLIRQFLTEGILLALISASVGTLIAFWVSNNLVKMFPPTISNMSIPRVDYIPLDKWVFLFTLILSILTGIIFSLIPALQLSKPQLVESLKDGSKGSIVGITTKLFSNIFVVSEIALGLILLVGACLLTSSFWRLQETELGFNTENVMTMRLTLPTYKYEDGDQQIAFVEEALKKLKAIPGVDSAAAINFLPLSGWHGPRTFTIEGRPLSGSKAELESEYRVVSSEYFQTMRIPLIRGRYFTDRDRKDSVQVAIINESAARHYWHNEDPVGKRINVGGYDDPDWREIIGIIGDVRYKGQETKPEPEIYRPYLQDPWRLVAFTVKTSTDDTSYATSIRDTIWAIDKDQAVSHIMSLDQLASESLILRRVSMMIIVIFAVMALILAAIGIYDVVAYSVVRRTQEIGIRMALGAQSNDVLKLMIKRVLTLSIIGVIIGIAGAIVLTKLLSVILFNVKVTDPLILSSLSLLMILVAFIAAYIPARRATKVDPMIALRCE